MSEHVFQFLIPATGLITGLIGAYVGLQNRALLAEVRREIAEMANRVFERIDGRYVRAQECHLRESYVHEKLEELAAEVRAVTRRVGS
jgi:hypothetical protein